MKTLIVSLNSKFIHTPLAAWYLKAACDKSHIDTVMMEATVNDSFDNVLSAIYTQKSDVVAFSCYIWNIRYVIRLLKTLKKISPGIITILGGPEVSFDCEQIMVQNPEIDYIIAGEAEESLPKLLASVKNRDASMDYIPGLYYRNPDRIVSAGEYAIIKDLSSIPSPYTLEMLETASNRIIYYEASRGCPFTCAYCLSSTSHGVRQFPLNRVKKELEFLIRSGVKQVKFVDRTFNCNKERAGEIISFIEKTVGDLGDPSSMPNFHFEAAADLFDEQLLDIISKAPHGLFQFEIGIQSVNERTLETIGRKTDTRTVFDRVTTLMGFGNAHIHLDLIAGLPYEDINSFRKSFNDVYGLKPHMLQLGFLKLLRGTDLRKKASLYNYVFSDEPPYEILSGDSMTYDDILELKDIEEALSKYYNSGKFYYTLRYMINHRRFPPYDFYKGLKEFGEGLFPGKGSLTVKDQYTLLKKYAESLLGADDPGNKAVNELLKLDYFASNRWGGFPETLDRAIPKGFREKCLRFLLEKSNIESYLPGFVNIPAKEIHKNVHFEVVEIDPALVFSSADILYKPTVVLFDYSEQDAVTGLFRHTSVEIPF